MKNKLIEFARLEDWLHVKAIEKFDDSDERGAFLNICALSKIDFCLDFLDLSEVERKRFCKLLSAVDIIVESGLFNIDEKNNDVEKLIQLVKDEAKRLSKRSL